MAIEEPQFSIVRDPKNPKLWAYEELYHWKRGKIVGGFRSSKDARRAFERAKKAQ